MIARVNTSYQKHSSIDFQSFSSRIWKESASGERDSNDNVRQWMLYAIVGVISGISAFIIDFLVDHLVLFKWSTAQKLIEY